MRRKTHEQFCKEVYYLVNNEYSVLSQYENCEIKVLLRHNFCKNEFLMTPSHFLSGERCPICFGKIKKTTEQFKREVFVLVKNEYEVIGEYKNNRTKIPLKHNLCNHEFLMTPTKFLQGQRCPHCFGNIRKTTEQYRQEVYNLVGDEYLVVGEYKNNWTKIKMKHILCNNNYNVTSSDFLSGKRCPKCNESKGEKRITKYLQLLNLNFLSQYKFKDCKYKRRLPFDFAVFDTNNNLIFLVEYDGEQHFKPWYKFGKEKGDKKFKDTQRNDSIKTNYCLINNISLLRIPYWDFDNIEQILNKELSKYNSLGGDYQREVKINDSFKLGCISA